MSKGKKKEGSKNNTNPKSKKIVKFLWVVFAAIIGITGLTFGLIATGIIGYMPPIEDLENPIDKYASQVYSSDNELLGTYSQSKENRIYSNYDQLSPYLVQALIATEDARFYGHSGIDFYAVSRAVVKRVIFQQESGGGGSTISQQLAKQLYSPPAESFLDRILQKPIEWVIAVQLERYYTKEEIINLYLNKFDFLNNAVGIQTASKVYFNKLPSELTIEEAATLIGMCKNPSVFNPKRRPEATRGRRNVVLEQMYKANYITKAQLDSLTQLPLTLDYVRVDHKDGLAPYFREYLRKVMTAKKPDKSNYASWQMEQYAVDSTTWENDPLYGWCNKNTKSDGKPYSLYTDGLKIYTTVDSRMQTYAEEAVREHFSKELQPLFNKEKKGRSYAPFSSSVSKQVDSLIYKAMKVTDRYRSLKKDGKSESEILAIFKKPVDMKVFSWGGEIDTTMTPWDSIRYHKSFLRTGFMAMDAHNGQVKAYVGGIDFKYFQYDMVNIGRRQVGSTVKPFLYSLCMQEGMTPCDQLLYEQRAYITESGKPWSPRGARTSMLGQMVSVKWGLQNSDNIVTAYMMSRTTPYALVRMLHTFGITGKIDPVLALSLGTPDVSVSEMAGAYTAFANNGIRVNPLYVTRIEDAYGNTIATFDSRMQEVFNELTAVKMLDMLRAVMDGGTGSRIRYKYGLKAPMGGKTGTTQNNSDGWFMGFTPSLVTATWVGGEDRSIHFDGTAQGQGASMALPIYGLFMQKIYADPRLGYSAEEQFAKSPSNLSPCAGSSIDETLMDANSIQNSMGNGGIDDMFDSY
ncbi:transglycosylase domain-containing protein [Dysgonomonas macrotermitis]|uniref:Penicillin-binding protein 1A n=1 Tax=Dysgonomonas macrotermitis TaxID=1346286 RepID=A0A1M4TYE6_9BACT|nr:transglycosylase domain-containing protein [Dysgonomonas macrotermitis]SHE49469.1 penicillin-binding protein 1A [Dysgonomonas macrotermitis]